MGGRGGRGWGVVAYRPAKMTQPDIIHTLIWGFHDSLGNLFVQYYLRSVFTVHCSYSNTGCVYCMSMFKEKRECSRENRIIWDFCDWLHCRKSLVNVPPITENPQKEKVRFLKWRALRAILMDRGSNVLVTLWGAHCIACPSWGHHHHNEHLYCHRLHHHLFPILRIITSLERREGSEGENSWNTASWERLLEPQQSRPQVW